MFSQYYGSVFCKRCARMRFLTLAPLRDGHDEELVLAPDVQSTCVRRGEEVVTLAVEAPPPNEGAIQRAQVAPKGPGAGQPAGRGMPAPVPGQVTMASAPVRHAVELSSNRADIYRHSPRPLLPQ